MTLNCAYRVIDFETTGLEDTDMPVEVAYADLEGGYATHFATLVKPGREISNEAKAVHHITDEHLVDAPAWAAIKSKLVEDYRIAKLAGNGFVHVAHNAAFDSKFLGNTGDWLCTYRLALHFWPELPRHSNQYLRYALGLDVVVTGPPHRALPDVQVTTALLQRCLVEASTREIETVTALIEFANRPAVLHQCNFGKHRGTLWRDVPKGYLRWMLDQPASEWDPDVRYTAKHYSRG